MEETPHGGSPEPVDLRIRAARVDDAQQLALLHVEAWRVGYAGLLPDEFLAGLSVDSRATFWEKALDRPGAVRTLVATVGGAVAGFVSVGASRDDDVPPSTGELWALNTLPAAWGQGVGTALNAAAVRELGAMGFTSAMLWVLTGNDRARRFYERRGWVEEGRVQTDWADEVRFDETRYRLAASA